MRSDTEQQDLPGLSPGGAVGTKEPFARDNPPDRFFSDTLRTQRLGLMLHLAPFGGVLLLTGDKGIGKSAFLQQFISRLGDNYRPLVLPAGTDLTARELFAQIKTVWLQHSHADEMVTMNVIRKQLARLRDHGEIPIIIIDDAERLPDETLLLLGKLITADDAGQQLVTGVLAGLPGLRQRLMQPELWQLQASVMHSFDLLPLQQEDSARYIKHQLNRAGVEPGRLFSPAVLRFIHLASGGVPRRINEFARIIWRNGSDSFRRLSNAMASRQIRLGLRLMLPVAGLAIVIMLLMPQLEQLRQTVATAPVEDPSLIDNKRTAASTTDQVTANGGGPQQTPHRRVEAVKHLAGADDTPAVRLQQETVQSLTVAAATGVVSAQLNASPQQPVADESNVAGSGKSDRAADIQMAQIDDQHQTGQPAEAPESPAQLAPKMDREQVVAGPADEQQTAAVKPGGSPPTVSATNTLPAAVPVVTLSLPVERHENWLLEQQQGHYTVQLTAMEMDKIERFIGQQSLTDQVHVFRVKNRRGDTVVAVAAGDYQGRSAAEQAAQQYQRRIAGIKPWVRSLASVQQSVNDFRLHLAEEQHSRMIHQHEQRLLEKIPQRYTLQLMAMDDKSTMDYVRKHGLQDDVTYFRPLAGQQGLLAAVTGEFASKDEAETKARELARQLPGIKPWARSVASVQNIIRQRQTPARQSP